MTHTYEITAVAEGEANFTVEAETEEEAEAKAYEDTLTGIDIGCGSASWSITHIHEVE